MAETPNLRDRVEKLKFIRKLTFSGIASQIGMTDAAFRRILDRNDCKLSTLYKLADTLEVSVVEFLTDEGEIWNFTPNRRQEKQPTESDNTELEHCREKVKLLEELLKTKDELIFQIKEKSNV